MKNENKTAIKKIVLDVRGKEIVLTVDEAKELKSILSELFGRDVVKETIIKDNYLPPYNPRPFWYFNDPTYSSGTEVTCSDAKRLADMETLYLKATNGDTK